MIQVHEKNGAMRGVVTSRRCDCCGHHEIGMVTANGDFVTLRPGMRVHIENEAGRVEDEPSEPESE